MQEQTCQDRTMDMPDEQTVERVAMAIWLHSFPECQPPLNDNPMVTTLFGMARAAIAAMPDTKALEAADRLAEIAGACKDYASDASKGYLWYETSKDGSKALAQLSLKQGQNDYDALNAALTTYRAARDNKP